MKFQIDSIIIYGKNNKIRTIKLKPNSVNIITGPSATGKSALIRIVDYCLGAKKCKVPDGAIAEHTLWFAVKLLTSSGEIFIARRNPKPDNQSCEDIYIERGKSINLPQPDKLVKLFNLDQLKHILTQELDVGEYTCDTQNSSHHSGIADVRKALFYCFQEQSEIGNPENLFHRQSDYYTSLSIKDFLPYFLGAITEENLKLNKEIKILRKKLKNVEEIISDNKELSKRDLECAISLLDEARVSGLIPMDSNAYQTRDWKDARRLLNEALHIDPDQEMSESEANSLDALLREQSKLRKEFREITERIDTLKQLKYSSQEFKSERNEQKSRLESIQIFDHNPSLSSNPQVCPLCSSTLTLASPSFESIRKTISGIQSQLESVENDSSFLNSAIKQEEENKEKKLNELKRIKDIINLAQKKNENLNEYRQLQSDRIKTQGKISFFLEKWPTKDSDIYKEEEVKKEKILAKIKILEKEIKQEDHYGILNNIIIQISDRITLLAKKLELEYSEQRFFLNPQQLTVIAFTDSGPVPMSQMGSGKNWVGLHVATHLSLHQWFAQKKRPVPQFLFLDQPSQPYFPADTPVESILNQTETENPDRQAVIKMFKLIAAETKGFQVIITEHADIKEDWYQELICENWWNGQSLIPQDWIEGNQ